MKKEKQLKHGIRIRSVNHIMIAATIIIYVLLLFLTLRLYKNYEAVEESTQNYFVCQQMAEQLRHGSDYLTEQVRLYAVTGEMKYARAYFKEVNETKSREQALQALTDVNVKESLKEQLAKAMGWSNALLKIEFRSMRLTAEAYGTDESQWPEEIREVVLEEEDLGLSREEIKEKGRMLVFDDTYMDYKAHIYEHLDTVTSNVLLQTQNNLNGSRKDLLESLSGQRTMMTCLFFMNLIMFTFVIKAVIHPIGKYVENIQDGTPFEESGSYELKYLAQKYNENYRLRYYADHDKLTGLLNRAAYESLMHYFAEKKTPLAFVLVDVDFFKTVNDTYGHEMGDEVLRKVAGLLKESVRMTDRVIRYGGDEFLILMTHMTAEKASVIREKIAAINKILQNPDDGLPPVSVSAGAAFSPGGYDDTIFKRADDALYEVKENGRGSCCIYDS